MADDPRPPLPHAIRVFAQVRAFDVACPACGVVSSVTAKQVGRRRVGQRYTARRVAYASGYDRLTGVLTCRGCRRAWYVGLMLWAAKGGRRAAPRDTVPTLEEAARQREAAGAGLGVGKVRDGDAVGPRGMVNLVCWCGQDCPAHPKGDDDGGLLDD